MAKYRALFRRVALTACICIIPVISFAQSRIRNSYLVDLGDCSPIELSKKILKAAQAPIIKIEKLSDLKQVAITLKRGARTIVAWRRTALAMQCNGAIDSDLFFSGRAAPNDLSNLQWALQGIQNTKSIPASIPLILGDGSKTSIKLPLSSVDMKVKEGWNSTNTALNTAVAVIDSGIDLTHPDLVNNIVRNKQEIAKDKIDNDKNSYKDDVFGYDFGDVDADPQDVNGHGTMVAGIIAAQGNNNLGITGAAWRLGIVPVKVTIGNSISTSMKRIELALNYVLARKRAGTPIRSVNISFGAYGSCSTIVTFKSALEALNQAGILIVTAAGNDGVDIGDANHPENQDFIASCQAKNVVVVGAVDQSGQRASFSNFSSNFVQIAAPGTFIYSTFPRGLKNRVYWSNQLVTFDTPDGYSFDNGTSFSAPFVTALAGLIFEKHPEYSAIQTAQKILKTSHPIKGLTGFQYNGIPDFSAALAN